MAYINSEKTAAIRNELKKAFPRKEGWELSVRNDNHSTVEIAIMKAPVMFVEKDYEQLNPYHLETYQNCEVLKYIASVANGNFFEHRKDRNYDNSDHMTDYFDVGWYVRMSVGRYDKPFQLSSQGNGN